MFANHPAIAKRWFREYGNAKGMTKANPQSESTETWRKGRPEQPKLPGLKRDFGGLSPSAVARVPPKAEKSANLMQSDSEQGVQFVHGSRGSGLGKAKDHPPGLRGRDTRTAARKRI